MKVFAIELHYDEDVNAAYIYLPMFNMADGKVSTTIINEEMNIDKVENKMIGIEILNAGEKLFISM